MDSIAERFRVAASEWLCDRYAVDIRFMSYATDDVAYRIFSASIGFAPLSAPQDYSFEQRVGDVFVGQHQLIVEDKGRLMDYIDGAIKGIVSVYGQTLRLHLREGGAPTYHSNSLLRNLWFTQLHLSVFGEPIQTPAPGTAPAIDEALRQAPIPFDGLDELASWLGLPKPLDPSTSPSLSIYVQPPADLRLDESELTDDHLTIVIHAHPDLPIKEVGLALRTYPGVGLGARRQAAQELRWLDPIDGRRRGILEARVENADQVLAMLMIGKTSIRRHWFLDSAKARNKRFLIAQTFDSDLKMTKRSISEGTDASKFEQAVATLLFIHGYAPAILPERDAPDIIVMSPNGQIVIVECTLRVADVNSKIGKLVDRRGALAAALGGMRRDSITAVLACALPRDQIAVSQELLDQNGIVLASREFLAHALESARNPSDPDEFLATLQPPPSQ